MIISFNCEKSIFFIFLFIMTTIIIGSMAKNNTNQQSIYPSISQSILIIFYLIEKKLIGNNKLNKFFNISIKNQSYKKYFILFSSVIFYLIFYYIHIFIQAKDEIIVRKNIQMCFFLLIDLTFFKNQRYSHQIFSTIIIFIITILSIISFVFPKFNFIILYYILSSYSYAFSLLIVKYINTKYFISVYIFGFIFGLLEIILLLIKGISFQFNFHLITILYFIGLIGNNYLFYYIISKLSPSHSIISQCISILLPMIFGIIYLSDMMLLILTTIGIIFGLIYLEIIELNFCNLNKNLKKNIFQRAEKEDNITLENIIDSPNTSVEN